MAAEVRQQRDKLLAFAFANADLLLEVNGKGRITFVLGAALRLIGRSSEAAVGTALRDILHPDDLGVVDEALARLELGQRFGPLSVRIQRPANADGGPLMYVSIGGCRMPPDDDNVYLAILETPMAERAVRAASRWLQVERDPASGLLNEEDFSEATRQAVEEVRQLDQPAVLTLIDLPGLGPLRHRAGEPAMHEFSRKLGDYLRSLAVGEATGRISDTKYGVLHDPSVDSGDIQERIGSLSREIDPVGQGVEVEASSVDVDPNLDKDDAGRALIYTINAFAGSDGALSVTSLNEAAGRMMQDALGRIAEFKSAVRDKQIRLVCQPIVSLETGEVHHHEILARFTQNPDTFHVVSFAEDVGIIQELDLAIAESALDLLIRYLPRRGRPDDVRLAVNLSGRSLKSDIFVRMLMNLLRAHRGDEDRLLFEVTESVNIENLDEVNTVIQEIRALGYRVCLDDFGAGAASFQYLQAFDVDFVKIDGAYVRNIDTRSREAVMLQSIATLAHNLGIGTVAEMVETETERQKLIELGVEFGQGYLFGKPRPIVELVNEHAKLKRGTA